MATKPLKSIKFPGLNDTYIIPEVELDDTLSIIGKAADAKATGDALAEKANIDGYYPDMTAGQITTNIHDTNSVPYIFRPTPFNSTRESGDIVGASVAWNQMLDPTREESAASSVSVTITRDGHGAITLNGTANANGSYVLYPYMPLVIGHKYLMGGYVKVGSNTGYLGLAGIKVDDGACGIYNNTTYTALNARIDLKQGDSFSNVTMKPYCVDLTLALGSTIADYIYTLESGTAGAGIAKLREWGFFTKPYYAHNAGGIESVNVSKHIMTGLNQWDEETELGSINTSGEKTPATNVLRSKNIIPVFPNTAYYFNTSAYIHWYAADMTHIIYNSPSAGQIITSPQNAYYALMQLRVGYGTTYKHDVCVNISNPAINGTYEPYTVYEYPLDYSLTLRGILKLDGSNNLYADGDVYKEDGTVTRKYAEVTIDGTLVSTVGTSSGGIKYATGGTLTYYGKDNINKVVTQGYVPSASGLIDKSVRTNGSNVFVFDNTFTDLASAQAALNANPIKLVYELVTPTTETADPYNDVQVCSPYGTEQYVDAGVAAGTRDVAIPVGHNTEYMKNIVGAIEGIPLPPTTNGNFKLRCTVASGVPTYSWVSE